MPIAAVVNQFISAVEAGNTVAALQDFYAADATMQENQHTPRAGRDALIAHERKALAGVKWMRIKCDRPVLIEQDHVVIRWAIEYETLKGKVVQFEELAYQTWDAQKITKEQFFYDPEQFNQSPQAGEQAPPPSAGSAA